MSRSRNNLSGPTYIDGRVPLSRLGELFVFGYHGIYLTFLFIYISVIIKGRMDIACQHCGALHFPEETYAVNGGNGSYRHIANND